MMKVTTWQNVSLRQKQQLLCDRWQPLQVSWMVLSDHGIKVPEDFEIINSDDSLSNTLLMRPNLSTTQPLYDLGAI